MFDDLLGFVKERPDIAAGKVWFEVRDFLPEPERPPERFGKKYDQYRAAAIPWSRRKALLEETLRVLERFNMIEQSKKEGNKSVPSYRFLPGEYEVLLGRLAQRAERRRENGCAP